MTQHDPSTTDTAELTKPKPLLTAGQAAAHLGVTAGALERWRGTGGGPAYIKLSGKFVRYRQADLDAFVEQHRRHNTSEAV